MKRSLRLLLSALVAFALAFCALSVPNTKAEEAAILSGRITAEGSGAGIDGVFVTVPDIEPGTGRDLRPEGQTGLRLRIWTGRIAGVTTLADGRLDAGPHAVTWDGKNEAGKSLASGIYFARLAAGGETAFRKMALLK